MNKEPQVTEYGKGKPLSENIKLVILY